MGRGDQHQKQRAMGLVLGGGPAAFRSKHERPPIGRAQIPPARSTAWSQMNLEERQVVGHRFVSAPYFDRPCCAFKEFMKKVLKAQKIEDSLSLSELGRNVD
jgi:hypothetical protein